VLSEGALGAARTTRGGESLAHPVCSQGVLVFARGLGTLGTFEGSVARLLARKLRRISKEFDSYEPQRYRRQSIREERRRSRHPHPEASQSRVREVPIATQPTPYMGRSELRSRCSSERLRDWIEIDDLDAAQNPHISVGNMGTELFERVVEAFR